MAAHDTNAELLAEYCQNRTTELADKIIQNNTLLIETLIRKYFPSYYRGRLHEDLVQAGRIGIFKALSKYDVTQSRFSTFVTPYVNGEIKQVISSETGNMSKHNYNLLKKVKNVMDELEQKGITHPTIEEIHKETGIPMKTIESALRISNLADPIHYDDKVGLSIVDSGSHEPSVADIVEDRIMSTNIRTAIDSLPEVHRLIILYYYGFIDDTTYTDTNIASKLTLKGYKVTALKVRALRTEAENLIKRAPIVRSLYRDGRYSVMDEDNAASMGLLPIYSEDIYANELNKLDAIDSTGINFDFSREITPFDDDENDGEEMFDGLTSAIS